MVMSHIVRILYSDTILLIMIRSLIKPYIENRFYVVIVVLIFSFNIVKGQQPAFPGEGFDLHKVEVVEIIQTKNYTYIQVAENNEKRWIASPLIDDAKIGATYYYQGDLLMKNFNSKELNRTFESVTFVEGLVPEQIYSNGQYPVKGGTTITDLFNNKDMYDGQIIKVRGKVTKFNENILSKNWIHLDDGTNILGKKDFVVTSQSAVQVGDIVTFQGKISKHVDLGHGYKFEVLMEDAKLLK